MSSTSTRVPCDGSNGPMCLPPSPGPIRSPGPIPSTSPADFDFNINVGSKYKNSGETTLEIFKDKTYKYSNSNETVYITVTDDFTIKSKDIKKNGSELNDVIQLTYNKTSESFDFFSNTGEIRYRTKLFFITDSDSKNYILASTKTPGEPLNNALFYEKSEDSSGMITAIILLLIAFFVCLFSGLSMLLLLSRHTQQA
jgi:hypothetical protein